MSIEGLKSNQEDSSLAWACPEKLNMFTLYNKVWIFWALGPFGIEANKTTNELGRRGGLMKRISSSSAHNIKSAKAVALGTISHRTWLHQTFIEHFPQDTYILLYHPEWYNSGDKHEACSMSSHRWSWWPKSMEQKPRRFAIATSEEYLDPLTIIWTTKSAKRRWSLCGWHGCAGCWLRSRNDV